MPRAPYSAPASGPAGAAFAKKWPYLARLAFIIAAASLCWAIPAALLYWLLR
jgi:hypothetical protein